MHGIVEDGTLISAPAPPTVASWAARWLEAANRIERVALDNETPRDLHPAKSAQRTEYEFALEMPTPNSDGNRSSHDM